MKPTNGTITPDYVKNKINNFFFNLNKLPYTIVITDPDYFYTKIDVVVEYNSTETVLSNSDIETKVFNNISNYYESNNNRFNSDLVYSKLVSSIDSSDVSITGNDTNVKMIKRIYPLTDVRSTYVINYGNTIKQIKYAYEYGNVQAGMNEPSFYSSVFSYTDKNGVVYPNCILRDDNQGNLIILTNKNNIISKIDDNLGTINYNTGVVQINNILVSSFQNLYVSLYAVLENKNIEISKNQILMVDSNDVNINVKDLDKQN